MDTENVKDNTSYYVYGEKTIKANNRDLWVKISSYLPNLDIKFKERFYLYETKSNLPKCDCGSHLKFIDMRRGFREFCSKSCMSSNKRVNESRRKTCLSKYGVDNPSKSKKIKEKVKKSNMERFGVEYPLQSDTVKDKNREYFLSKYGVDNPSKIPEIRRKAEETNLERFGKSHAMQNEIIKKNFKSNFLNKHGVDNPSKIQEVREKAKETMVDKYGVEFPLQNEELMKKYKDTNLEKYGSEFYTQTDIYKNQIKNLTLLKNIDLIDGLISIENSELVIHCFHCDKDFTIQRQLWRKRKSNGDIICLNCNPITNSTSKCEKEVVSYIKSIYQGEVLENYRLENTEIDIFLPEFNIGFEYNGLYWHSELNKPKNYHINKTKFFEKNGISLIHVWEDDWKYKNDIVKSIISNKISKSNRIFARKCEIREIDDNNVIREFLNKNHMQGYIGSNVKIGLYYKGHLVSLMSFGGMRKSLGQKSEFGSFEMLRFCNKINTSVVGGASKIIKYFKEKYKPNSITSYSDRSRGVGNLYKKVGFSLVKETDLNYYWCINGVRYHRFNFRKDKLVKEGFDNSMTEIEIMHSRGYFRVFDCGSSKWIFT